MTAESPPPKPPPNVQVEDPPGEEIEPVLTADKQHQHQPADEQQHQPQQPAVVEAEMSAAPATELDPATPVAPEVAVIAENMGVLPDAFYQGLGMSKCGTVMWTSAVTTLVETPPSPSALSPCTPKKKKKPPPIVRAPSMSGLSPEMRKIVRRQMASNTDEAPRKKELSPELQEELTAKRAMRRRVAEFWSKGAHGYTFQDLLFVRTVNLSSCSLTDEDGIAFASVLSKEMKQLKTLDLFSNRLHDPSLVALSAAFAAGAAPLLTHLQFGHNAFADEGVKSFASTLVEGALPRLESLSLVHNQIGAAGAEAIAQAAVDGAFASLAILSLSGNPIGDAGVRAIAGATEDDEILPKLVELHLRETTVGEKGLAALSETLMPKTGGLPCLRTLVVDESYLEHAKLKEVYMARTGQGGVHALKLQCF